MAAPTDLGPSPPPEALDLIRELNQYRAMASPEEFGFLCSRLRREMQAYLHARDMRREVSAPPISGTQDAVPLGNTRPPGPSGNARRAATNLLEWSLTLAGDDLLLEGRARDGRRITAGRVMKYIAPNVFTSTGVYAVSSGTTFTTSVPEIVIKRCAKFFPYHWRALARAWRQVYDESTVVEGAELASCSSPHLENSCPELSKNEQKTDGTLAGARSRQDAIAGPSTSGASHCPQRANPITLRVAESDSDDE